jgi:predicted  nucleic acid-binding Zn-ribbon protein
MDLKLNVLLALVEKATGPLKSITGQATQSAKALRDTRQRLKDLEKTQGAVNAFRNLSRGGRDLARDLKTARDRASAMGKAIADSGMASRAQIKDFAAARAEVKKTERDYASNQAKLKGVREQLNAAGVSTKNLAGAERQLRGEIASVNATMATQQQRMSGINQQQQRMAAARSQLQRTQGVGANMAIGGAAAMATGHAVLGAVRPGLDEAKAFQQQVAQLRSQGLGDDAVADAVKFARSMDIVGSSATDNLKLLKEANSVLRDMHESEQVTPYLARMKFGIEAVMAQKGHGEGHGENAEAMFMDLLKVAELRGAAKNPESLKRVLDYATQAYVASGGLVKPEDLLNMIKTGGVAAKQLDDKTFFFGLLHTMQEMGGHRAGTGLATAYQNFAAGRTTQQAAEELASLGLLNKNAVKYGKTGHVTKLLPDALKDGDLYRSNPYEFLMQRIVPKLNPGGALTDQQVVSKINALFSGRKGGDLFASLYLERNNIAKHLAAAPKAYGVDALYKEAGGTAGGMEIDLEAKKRDLYRELGTQLLPVYVAGLTKLVAVVKRLTAWAEGNPRLAKALTITAGGFGVLATAAGGLMIALGGLLSQFALLRFAFKATGIRLALGRMLGAGAAAAGSSAAAAGGTAAAGAAQAGLLARLGSGARIAALAVAGLSGATLAAIAAVLALVVVTALVIRKYWEPIKAWFQGVGQGIGEGIAPAFDRVKQAVAPLAPAFAWLADVAGDVWQWFMQLIEPVKATSQQLDGARASGASFGNVIGAALGVLVDGLTYGVRMFIGLGEAIGNAAGWVVVTWGQIGEFFTGLWHGIQDGATTAMDWIHEKIERVRGVIERLYAMWQRITGHAGAGAGEPLDWIMPGDSDKARRISDSIARNPMGAKPGADASIVTPRAIAAGAGGDTYHVQVDARGMSPQEAQQAINNALRDHQRSTEAKKRSAYSDED